MICFQYTTIKKLFCLFLFRNVCDRQSYGNFRCILQLTYKLVVMNMCIVLDIYVKLAI